MQDWLTRHCISCFRSVKQRLTDMCCIADKLTQAFVIWHIQPALQCTKRDGQACLRIKNSAVQQIHRLQTPDRTTAVYTVYRPCTAKVA